MIIYISIVFFSVAAILGITVLVRWLQHKDAAKGIIYSHGAVAVAALVILVAYSIMHPHHFPVISLALFPLGAIAGLYMFFTYKEGTKKPISVAFIHAFFVVSGFVALLIFVFSGDMNEELSLLN
jgi:hypothetical protein